MWEWARKSLTLARELGDPPTLATCTALTGFADACVGLIEDAKRHTVDAAGCIDALSDEQLAQRLDAGLFLMAAELHLDGSRVGVSTGCARCASGARPARASCCPPWRRRCRRAPSCSAASTRPSR